MNADEIFATASEVQSIAETENAPPSWTSEERVVESVRSLLDADRHGYSGSGKR